MNILEKYALGGVMLLVIFFAGAHFGDKRATEKYLPQIQQLKDSIDTADKNARQKQAEYQENNDEIQRKNDQRINDIRKYYANRMLSIVPSKDCPCSASSNPEANDGASGEHGASAKSFEESCVEDANKVVSFQDWVRINKIPIK